MTITRATFRRLDGFDFGPAGLAAPEWIAERLDHLPRCTGPRYVLQPQPDGDLRLRCTGCKRYLPIRGGGWEDELLAAFDRLDPPTPASPPAVTSRFYCRAHLDRRVDWRGHGCPECAEEVKNR